MSVGPTPPPKWLRARQLINQLDGEILAYLDRAAAPNSTSEGQVVLRILESPPESLSLLLGDALQNLHSALDHEVHRQSVARMGPAWPGLERCAFPTFDDAREYPANRKRLIGGLRPEVQAAVDRSSGRCRMATPAVRHQMPRCPEWKRKRRQSGAGT